MTITLAGVAPIALFGIALAAGAMLSIRWIATMSQRDDPQLATLPIWLRLALRPATMLAPWVARIIPASWNTNLERSIESLGLHPALSPSRWLAVRLVLGALCAASGLGLSGLPAGALAAVVAFWASGQWLSGRLKAQAAQIARELPAYLDLMTVCVEAGATLTAGVRLIVAQSPPSPVRSYFERVLREVRSGRPRAQAFTHVAALFAVESLATLAGALAHAEASGMSLGQVLRVQAEQRTAERFARAERLAMQAPVKMLGPLILCIFPCTFIVIAVPIAVRLREALGS